jgi:hypothetical protein
MGFSQEDKVSSNDSDNLVGVYIGVIIVAVLLLYGVIALMVGAGNAMSLMEDCNSSEKVNGEYQPSKTIWIANPLTIGLTGECREK